MRSTIRALGWLAAALALGACANDQPGSDEAAATSCEGATLDSGSVCRMPGGQFAPSTCCQWGALPADLQKISDRFDGLVLDPFFGQDEVTFESERFKFASADPWQHIAAVSVAEAKRLVDASWSTEKFTVLDLQMAGGTQLDALIAQVFPYESPYFCGTYKELSENWDTPNYDERCRELTRELFAELGDYESGLRAYGAKMIGNEWGDLEYVRLYITSAEDPSQALVFDFDLVHEI